MLNAQMLYWRFLWCCWPNFDSRWRYWHVLLCIVVQTQYPYGGITSSYFILIHGLIPYCCIVKTNGVFIQTIDPIAVLAVP